MFHSKLLLQSLTLFTLVLAAGCSSSNPNRYFENDGPPGLLQKKLLPWGGEEVKLKVEQPNKWANRPYTVLGKRYQPVTGDKPMTQVGTASWYGKQFHGKKTAIGEIYDMHAFTAAHPTMELPSFAKVTNLENGRSIIVRVNDRGPFLHGRAIDLSYAAAVKLGYQKQGTARVRIERITRRDIAAGRIPSVSSNNAVLVASNAPTKTAAPSQPAARSRIQETSKTVTTAASSSNSSAASPSAVSVRVLSAEKPQVSSNEDVMRTVIQDSEFSIQESVTLSIPVESTQDLPSLETNRPHVEDGMQELIAKTDTAEAVPPQAPAEVLPRAIPTDQFGSWAVQIGAYGVQENAKQAAAHAEMMLASVQNAQVRVVDTGKVWKVLSGSFASKDEASRFANTVTQALGMSAFVVAQ